MTDPVPTDLDEMRARLLEAMGSTAASDLEPAERERTVELLRWIATGEPA